MAEENGSGFLSTISHQRNQNASSNNVELFGDSIQHSSSDWQSSSGLTPEISEKTQFLLSNDDVSTRATPLQAKSGSGFGSQGGDGTFDYQKEMQTLDKLAAQLESVKQQLMTDILRCRLLQIDLATQFDPKLVQKLRSTKLACEKCEENFDDSTCISD